MNLVLIALSFVVGCLIVRLISLKERLLIESSETRRIKEELATKTAQCLELSQEVTKLKTTVEFGIKIDKERNLLKDELTTSLKNAASEIVHRNTQQFYHDSSFRMRELLDPLDEKLKVFSETIHKFRDEEIRETTSLKTEIASMKSLNSRLGDEAQKLSRALKGDCKLQGNWGELVLEKILEDSGLRRGYEYVAQGEGLDLRNTEDGLQRPDIIVNLPHNRHVVIDAKVSLKSFSNYVSPECEDQREKFRKEFISSVKEHVRSLSSKHYHRLDKLNTPEFVLLFVPIEGAFALYLQSEPEAYRGSIEKNIIIVSPTTLVATLCTIDSLWRQERRNQSAHEIAKIAGEIYDKFSSMCKDLNEMDASLMRSRLAFNQYVSRLQDGRDNLIMKLQQIKSLGAKTTKGLNLNHPKDCFNTSKNALPDSASEALS